MLSTAVMWNQALLALLSRSAPSVTLETLLAGAIELLSLIFLVAGGLAFFRVWRMSNTSDKKAPVEAMQPPDRMQMNGRRQPGMGLALSFALVLPVIALLLLGLSGTAASFLALSPVSTSAPQRTSTAAPTKSPPTIGKTPTFTLPTLPGNALVKSGTLTIGTSAIFPDQVSIDPKTHKLVGFDVDLITKIAQLLHLQPNIVQMNFNQLIPMLNSKKIDVVIAAYALTNVQSFQSVPYLAPHEVVLTLKSNLKVAHFTTLTDLCGLKVGVLKDSNEDNDLKVTQCGQGSSIQITEEQNVDAVSADLASGKVDATYQDSPTTQYYESKYPQKFQSAGSITGTQEGMLVRGDNTTLAQAIQAAFAQLQQNNTYNQLLSQYKLTPDSILAPGTAMEGRVGKMPEGVSFV